MWTIIGWLFVILGVLRMLGDFDAGLLMLIFGTIFIELGYIRNQIDE